MDKGKVRAGTQRPGQELSRSCPRAGDDSGARRCQMAEGARQAAGARQQATGARQQEAGPQIQNMSTPRTLRHFRRAQIFAKRVKSVANFALQKRQPNSYPANRSTTQPPHGLLPPSAVKTID